MAFFIKRNEQVEGPLTEVQITSSAANGKLKPADMIATSKDGPWSSLTSSHENNTPQARPPEPDNTMVVQIWINNNGTVIGPITERKLYSSLASGKIGASQTYSTSRNGPWCALSKFSPAALIAASAPNWYWMKSGFFNSSTNGPISGQKLIAMKKPAKIPVQHTVFTNNEWVNFEKTLLPVAKAAIQAKQIAEQDRLIEERLEHTRLEEALTTVLGRLMAEEKQRTFEEKQFLDQEYSQWDYSTKTDDIDDSVLHVFGLKSITGTDRFGKPINLCVRFFEGASYYPILAVDILLTWGTACFAGGIHSGSQPVTVRVDKENAESLDWNVTEGLNGTILKGGSAFYGIRSLIEADTVVFQTTPYHSATITAKFDVRGLYSELAAFSNTIQALGLIPAEAKPCQYWHRNHLLYPTPGTQTGVAASYNTRAEWLDKQLSGHLQPKSTLRLYSVETKTPEQLLEQLLIAAPKAKVTFDEPKGQLIVEAPAEQHHSVQATIKKLGAEGDDLGPGPRWTPKWRTIKFPSNTHDTLPPDPPDPTPPEDE